ncbi:MAG TPA: hypothetical protein VH643_06100 [Gemmataceae bacterium]|jgi:hypothetical protein
MKQAAYLLVFLTCGAQLDDVPLPWDIDAQSAPLPDDDDEYIPSNSQDQETRSVGRQRPGVIHLNPRPGVFGLVSSGVPSELTRSTPLAPPPLYVFMSLQR